MAWPFPEIYVLRHGQTEWNAQGRLQGALNSPLTAQGVQEAQAQNRILRGCDLAGFTFLSSPQGRAFQTAGIALAGVADRITTLDSLHEITVGDWAGILKTDLPELPGSQDTPDGVLELYEHAPGGEGFQGLQRRCLQVLQGLTGPSVLVTHGITSRMLRCLHLGQGIDYMDKLPGGQGVVYHLKDGQHHRLTENDS